jgi:long-chain acyl-CoA synthetase
MLTHANLVSNISAVLMTSASAFSATDVHISFLPLAHMFERLCIGMLLAVGGAAGFFRGDVTQLLDDVSALQPTIFAGVPRLYNRIYDKIRGQVKEAGGIKQSLFDYAYASKQSALRESGSLTHWLWDPVGMYMSEHHSFSSHSNQTKSSDCFFLPHNLRPLLAHLPSSSQSLAR